MPAEYEMLEHLRTGKVSLPPLSLRFLEHQPGSSEILRLDALLEVSWGDSSATFALECKSLSTPKAFQAGINQLKTAALSGNCLPMLFAPFLNEQQLLELERERISGIDLCGNGVVIAPGMYSVYRTGGNNRFRSSAAIKNIYRKNTSMVGRTFLLCSRFETVQDIYRDINRRNLLVTRWDNTAMSLSTVSKALKSLEEDLIISREGGISLLQPQKLLQNLTDNYEPPKIRRRILLKVPGEPADIPGLFLNESQKTWLPSILTGLSSVARYALMQRGDLMSYYCLDLEILQEKLSAYEDDRFPNIELIETMDETVYYDGRREGDLFWASPVQVYLELMTGDKRDRETAEQVKSYMLNNLQGK